MKYSTEEFMICALARELHDGETIAVGNSSPVPAAAALLAKETHAPRAQTYIMGYEREWPFEGTKEFFDYIQRGLVDVFFLSGAQIDCWGNINLHVIGDYARPKVRLPGGAGSSMVYYRCKRIFLFKTDHHAKGFPERLDFVSSSASPDFRQEGAGRLEAVYTPLAVLRPAPLTRRLQLSAIAPGTTAEEVQGKTGFDLGIEGDVPRIEAPSPQQLDVLRSKVKAALQEIYPAFVKGGIGNG
ncbi:MULTISPECIES: CoA-transferase [Paenibacillus]|uniref:Coenzyme A transferase n=1 Tax=Paenibacillus naphthalenovorans TaxID=162209 RepID=A0A0U2W5Q3_9BACL|nr:MULTISPECIES: CoA-transferase [Paenibacillus]ALS21774.1 coenzyme A transferase [Paenibacillus naphthalenovorans]GCL71502.1 hypothetical protein PN4B1_14070 [Paenibacillus naphthalenovorans]SDI83085.1 glutaconate CoA-transferase subunit B [Paenibacillus naphthalenovorans]